MSEWWEMEHLDTSVGDRCEVAFDAFMLGMQRMFCSSEFVAIMNETLRKLDKMIQEYEVFPKASPQQRSREDMKRKRREMMKRRGRR